jgi:hypothetical protein
MLATASGEKAGAGHVLLDDGIAMFERTAGVDDSDPMDEGLGDGPLPRVGSDGGAGFRTPGLYRAQRRRQRLPASDGPSALSRLHGIGDQRKQPAQAYYGRQCAALLEGGADRSGFNLRRRTVPEHGNADLNRQAPNGSDLAAGR